MEKSSPSSYILLIQTEEEFNQSASLDLQDLGYIPTIVSTFKQTLIEIEQLQPSLIMVDHVHHRKETLQFCRQLREREQGHLLYILMVLASDSVEERSACLEAGADDYLALPYRSETLIQLIRFYLQPSEHKVEQMQFGDLILDLTSRCLWLKEQPIDLTMKEFELLKYLMANPRQVLKREQILDNVWGYDFRGASNVIEVYIRYLRLKIEGEGQKRLIHTVRGVGYVLRDG
ncbi:MAG: response regulator transcription factor NblR [Microcystaceae cyanobacterium]